MSGRIDWIQASRLGLMAVFVLGGMWLTWLARPVLTPFLFAFVISYLLAPLVDWCGRLGLPRIVAILAIYALFSASLATLGIYLIPLLFQESLRMIQRLPQWTTALEQYWSFWLVKLHQAPIPPSIWLMLDQTTRHLESYLFSLVKSFLKVALGMVPGVISVLVAPVLAFFVLKDLDRIRLRFWSLIPMSWRPGAFKLGLDIDQALNGFIRGQLLVALLVAVLSTAWTMALGIPFALLIGALAGVTDVLPYVGPIVGAVPAIILALTISPWKVAYVVIGFIIIHQLEGTVIAPKVVGESVGLHPLVVIFALLAGGDIAGLTGLLLAVPLAAVAKGSIYHLFRRLAEHGLARHLPQSLSRRS